MPNLSLVTIFFYKVTAKKLHSKLVTSGQIFKLFFVVIDHLQQNEDHHWIPRDQLHRIYIFYMQKCQLKNLTFLSDLTFFIFPSPYLTLSWPDLHQSNLNRFWLSSNQFHWVGNEKLALIHASHGPIIVGFMCGPLVSCPLWPDVISVASFSNIGTRQLTLYRLCSIKFVLLDVITHSIEHPWTVKYLTFDLTCDVISDSEANEISFPSTDFPGLLNAVSVL